MHAESPSHASWQSSENPAAIARLPSHHAMQASTLFHCIAQSYSTWQPSAQAGLGMPPSLPLEPLVSSTPDELEPPSLLPASLLLLLPLPSLEPDVVALVVVPALVEVSSLAPTVVVALLEPWVVSDAVVLAPPSPVLLAPPVSPADGAPHATHPNHATPVQRARQPPRSQPMCMRDDTLAATGGVFEDA